MPFEVPEGWEWCRLDNICIHNAGKTLDKGRNTRGTLRKYITTSNLYWGYFDLTSTREMFFEEDELEKCTAIKGDLLVCEGGDAGRTAIWNYDFPIYFQNHIHRIRLFGNVLAEYIYYYMHLLVKGGGIEEYKKGIGIKGLSGKALGEILIPLPPLAEQHRIVERIEQLLPLINDYDVAEQKLTTLNESFPDQLKKSILQTAVQGKLVPQDPSDEPASVLLERIRAEKQQPKKGKQPLHMSHYEKLGEKPYEIPDNWAWIKLKDISILISGQDLQSNQYSENKIGIPYITGASNFENNQLLINRWTNIPKSISIKNDLLLTCKGTIGKIIFLQEDRAHIARQIMAIRVNSKILREYIKICIETYLSTLQANAKSLIPGIVRDNVLLLNIPLPPFTEQERIVIATKLLFQQIDLIQH